MNQRVALHTLSVREREGAAAFGHSWSLFTTLAQFLLRVSGDSDTQKGWCGVWCPRIFKSKLKLRGSTFLHVLESISETMCSEFFWPHWLGTHMVVVVVCVCVSVCVDARAGPDVLRGTRWGPPLSNENTSARICSQSDKSSSCSGGKCSGGGSGEPAMTQPRNSEDEITNPSSVRNDGSIEGPCNSLRPPHGKPYSREY